VFLELFPQQGEATEKDKHFSHLCLEVANIESTVEELTRRGAPLDADVRTGKDGNKQAWTHDPEGTRIELMELAPDSMQRQAIARLQKENS
jgi:lactoylglutathione lyase